MQCEIRTMGETNARARTGRTSDTLPKPGRVTEGKVEISLIAKKMLGTDEAVYFYNSVY